MPTTLQRVPGSITVKLWTRILVAANVAAQHPEKVKEMTELFQQIRARERSRP